MSFKIFASLGLDATGFEQGMKSASKAADGLSSKFASILKGGLFSGAGVAGALGLGAIFSTFESMIDKLQEKAKSAKIGADLLGIDPVLFQQIEATFDAVGGSAEQVLKGFEKIAEAQEQIKNKEDGWEKSVKQFAALGVSLKDLSTKSYQNVFFQIADAMKGATMDAEKLAAIHDRLGRGGAAMMPAFQKGFDSTAAMAGALGKAELETQQNIREKRKDTEIPFKMFQQGLAEAASDRYENFLSIFNKVFEAGPLFAKGTGTDKEVKEAEKKIKQLAAQMNELRAKQEKEKAEKEAREGIKRGNDEKALKANSAKILTIDEEAEKETRNLAIKKQSHTERMKFYKDEIKALQQRNNVLLGEMGENGDPNGAMGLESAKNRAQIAKDQTAIYDLLSQAKFNATPLDSLAKIGGFTGRADTGVEVQLRSMKDRLDQIAQNTSNTARALNP